MTVSVPTDLVRTYAGNGSSVNFSYPIRFDADDELVVALRAADDVETVQTLGADYTVSGAGTASGTVTFLTAPASGVTVIIYRATKETQPVDLEDAARNPAEAVELQLDRTVRMIQDVSSRVGLAVTVGAGRLPQRLPVPSDGRVLKWDGNRLANGPTESAVETAEASALAAAQSASDAAASENSATSSANAASASEVNAANSAASAAAAEATALSAETNASAAASSAAASASEALASATSAAGSETNAASSANAAAIAQVASEAARDQVLSLYDQFDDRYLGTKAADPTTDNDGAPLVAGALYYNSVNEVMMVYTGSAWVAAYVSGDGFLVKSLNLSDLPDPSAARTNLGLGTAATANTVDLATADQGIKADSAVQPGDLATVATTGDYSDLSNKPTLGTAAAANTGDFATAAEGILAQNALPKSGGDLSGHTDMANAQFYRGKDTGGTGRTLIGMWNDDKIYVGATGFPMQLRGSSINAENLVASGVAKAWVNFNGTGTVAIRDSFNVSSITDNGSGDYTVNFSTPMPNANYAVSAIVKCNGDWFNQMVSLGKNTDQYDTAGFRLRAFNTAGSLGDPLTVSAVVFGD